MKRLEVVFTKAAGRDLDDIEQRVAVSSGHSRTARRYRDRIVEACVRIGDAPEGSRLRDDIRPGLRLAPFERRLIIAYRLARSQVVVLRIMDGRRDFPRLLSAIRTR